MGQREREAPLDPLSRTAASSTMVDVGAEVVGAFLNVAVLDGGVHVTGTNALPWHGFRRYFGGRYLRVPGPSYPA